MSSPAPATSRRKSGRAVRAPEKFIPDAPSSQNPSGSAKRKRAGEEISNDASDIEESEESEEEVESAGEERVSRKKNRKPNPRAARKPTAKRAKVNGAATYDDDEDEDFALAQTLRLPARPKKSRKTAIQDESATGLYGKFSEGLFWERRLTCAERMFSLAINP